MKTFTFPPVEAGSTLVESILDGQQPVYFYGTYSAGQVRTNVIRPLFQRKLNILGVVSLNPEKWGSQLEGVKVIPPTELNDPDTPVIVCADSHFREIFKRLRRQGFKHILPYYFYLGGKTFSYDEFRALVEPAQRELLEKGMQSVDDPLVLHSIDVVITERCSLRCRDCSNLMQYFDNPKHEDQEMQLNALDKLMASVDAVHELRVLGGEPFVNPEFSQYVEHMKKYNNIGVIGIYTNGTILPKGEALQCLQDQRVFVRISDYGKASRKIKELEGLLAENEIFFDSYCFDEWLDCSGFQDRHRSDEELRFTFQVCCASNLYTLKDGRFYCCPFAANAAALHAIPSQAREGIDVCSLQAEELRGQVKDLMELPYIEACRFCSGRPRGITDIPAAVQASSPLPYQRQE